jgi:hypothetical protein
MKTFFIPVYFSIVLTGWGIPVYIIQFVITKYAGVKYRFILPIVSGIICGPLSLVFVFGLTSVESVSELFRRVVYGIMVLIVFQFPTGILLLVGYLTTKVSQQLNDIDKMKTLDLE